MVKHTQTIRRLLLSIIIIGATWRGNLELKGKTLSFTWTEYFLRGYT